MHPLNATHRTRRLPGVLLASLLVAGCGSAAPSEPAAAGTSPASADHHGHTMEDVDAWYGQPAAADEAKRTIEVTVDDDLAFDPDQFQVADGEVVRFVVTNVGSVEHEFVIGDQAAQQEMAEQMASGDEHAHHGADNAVTVHGGTTAELTWRFGTAGSLLVGCHVPGHYEAGMKAVVTVT